MTAINLEGRTDHTTLNLGGQNLRSIAELKTCTQLEHLDLSGNSAIEDLADVLPSLTSLKSLNLTNCGLKNVDFLARMKGLKILNLTSNPIEETTPIGSLTNLQELRMNSCGLTNVSFVSTLTSLEKLALYSNRIGDMTPAETCTKIEWLDISANPNSSIDFAKKLPELKRIVWTGSGIPIAAIRELKTARPSLRI
jgi:Leucine-rich repeat (LRR) protein